MDFELPYGPGLTTIANIRPGPQKNRPAWKLPWLLFPTLLRFEAIGQSVDRLLWTLDKGHIRLGASPHRRAYSIWFYGIRCNPKHRVESIRWLRWGIAWFCCGNRFQSFAFSILTPILSIVYRLQLSCSLHRVLLTLHSSIGHFGVVAFSFCV